MPAFEIKKLSPAELDKIKELLFENLSDDFGKLSHNKTYSLRQNLNGTLTIVKKSMMALNEVGKALICEQMERFLKNRFNAKTDSYTLSEDAKVLDYTFEITFSEQITLSLVNYKEDQKAVETQKNTAAAGSGTAARAGVSTPAAASPKVIGKEHQKAAEVKRKYSEVQEQAVTMFIKSSLSRLDPAISIPKQFDKLIQILFADNTISIKSIGDKWHTISFKQEKADEALIVYDAILQLICLKSKIISNHKEIEIVNNTRDEIATKIFSFIEYKLQTLKTIKSLPMNLAIFSSVPSQLDYKTDGWKEIDTNIFQIVYVMSSLLRKFDKLIINRDNQNKYSILIHNPVDMASLESNLKALHIKPSPLDEVEKAHGVCYVDNLELDELKSIMFALEASVYIDAKLKVDIYTNLEKTLKAKGQQGSPLTANPT